MAAAASEKEDNEREFKFTQRDFALVQKLIYEHAGISLKPSKRHMVYSRLVRRVRAVGLQTFSQYLELVQGPDSAERQHFVNALTTNLTAFFREPHHFEILTRHLQNLAEVRRRQSLSIWCAAASTGEEAYSIAMTVIDALSNFTPNVRIVASDVDTSVLRKAEDGVYPMERVAKLPHEKLRRFFMRGVGAQAGFVKMRDEVRRLVSFKQLNLLDKQWGLDKPFDAIFCRNVMIYFDKATQYRILQKFVPLLQRDGLLFAGHSESFYHAADLFEMRGKTVYALAGHGDRP